MSRQRNDSSRPALLRKSLRRKRLIPIVSVTAVLVAGAATSYAVGPRDQRFAQTSSNRQQPAASSTTSSSTSAAATTSATEDTVEATVTTSQAEQTQAEQTQADTAASSTDDVVEGAYYVSPSGSDSNDGSSAAPWATIAHAQSEVSAGDTVYFREGTYAYTEATTECTSQTALVDAITLSKSGTEDATINYFAYPGETPTFEFSAMKDDCRIKGFDVTGNYIHLKGLEITGVPQNNSVNHENWGVYVTGSDNTFEELDTHDHMGPGLFIKNGGGNLVLNSDSHDNYDLYTSNGAGESADGFGAHVKAGNPGNVFSGCRAWNNADDGFDLINAYSSVTIENSWAWSNGYVPGTTTAAGNGNGFKVGGYGGVYDSAAVTHTVRYSVAFDNRASGFYANHHPVDVEVYHNTSYNNHSDYNMLGIDSDGNAIGVGVLHDNIAYAGSLTSNMDGATEDNNSWNLGITLSSDDFQSLSTSGWDADRQDDGSLPELTSLHLASDSPLVGAASDADEADTENLGAF